MKKSTTILILIIYVASIVLVGFFGMSVKVYDEIKYVKNIEIGIEAENDDLYAFSTLEEKDSTTGNPQYNLTIHFYDYASRDEDDDLFVILNIIPKVTYDTGDMAGDTESIVYTLSSKGQEYADKGYISLNEYGTLVCTLPEPVAPNYKKTRIAFTINVDPAARGGNGTGAIINVYVI